MEENRINESTRLAKEATRVSVITIIGNLFLAIFKLLAGIFAHSTAMISDAANSITDVFSTFVVMLGIKLASKESDKEHPYGHERMECVAAIVLSMIVFMTGLAIGIDAVGKIFIRDYKELTVPGVPALFMAIVSIVTKEIMYWYTRYHAKRLDSSALLAVAWDHRSDAFSSIGALIGIAAARMGYPVMDPVASLVIFGFIMRAAVGIFKEAVDKMVDKSCDLETEDKICSCILEVEKVMGIDLLQTRVFGNKIYVDIEIEADGNMTLKEAHHIAEKVHDKIEQDFPKVKHIMVHVNPAE